MKKIYITPALQCNEVNCEFMIAESFDLSEETAVQAQGGLVKEDVSNRGGGYNVWDDDWSNN